MPSKRILSIYVLRLTGPSVLALLISAPIATSALAQTESPTPASAPPQIHSDSGWNVSGFGTLGVVDQSGGGGLRFLRNSTQLGSSSKLSALSDSRLGLQLDWRSGSQWEGGIQGVLLRRPTGTPASESIEWAYLGYRLWPDTRVRIGRTSPDLFLFSDSRNVGFALPWARPPVDFYGNVPLAAIDGIDIDQSWRAGDSTWRARATAGSVDTSVTDTDGTRLKFKGKDVMALSLTREEGGLLMKATFLRSRLRVNTGAGAAQLQQGLDELSALPVPGLADSLGPLGSNLWSGGPASYFGLAAMYETGPWTFVAEGSQVNVPRSPLSARRGYVSAGYRVGPVTYYGIASRVKPTKGAVTEPALVDALTPLIGPESAQQAQTIAGFASAAGNNFRYDQATVGVGLRWDFLPNAALKLQVDRFDVNRNGSAGWRYSDGRAAKGTLVSVLVDFVWGQ
ncbi:MAG: hypothetical protein JWQ41_2649 [Variovorax sp.]|nr:hypothetical protein [Variovorax sp.]